MDGPGCFETRSWASGDWPATSSVWASSCRRSCACSAPYAMLELPPEEYGTSPRLVLGLETQLAGNADTYVHLKDQGSGEPSITRGGVTFQRSMVSSVLDPGTLLPPQG